MNSRHALSMLAALAALTLGFQARAGDASTLTDTIVTQEGPVRGLNAGTLQSYLGIPYAAPPVGPLRWRRPQAVQSWSAVLDATKAGAPCAQGDDLGPFATAGGREDCLTLNVHVPQRPASPGRLRPVLVWIHGGSLLVGQGDHYDPTRLANQGDVVVVTLNYRLGLFGFFAHASLLAEDPLAANLGQLDQLAALDWVQRNAAAFGGDRQQVIIAGESSGGGSVLAHVISPLSAGRFQKAIVMSGASLILRHPTFGAARPLDDALQAGQRFAQAAGCVDQSAQCLRALSTDQVLALQTPYVTHQTIVDGRFMPQHPGVALASGHFNRVDLVVGTTRDEARFFAGLGEHKTNQPMSAVQAHQALAYLFGPHRIRAVERVYPQSAYDTPAEAYAAAATDYMFTCPALKVSRLASRWTRVHHYEFSDRTAPSYLKPASIALGAAHTLELPYLFDGFKGGQGGLKPMLNSKQVALSDTMIQAWSAVDTTRAALDWPAFTGRMGEVLRFQLPLPVRVPATRLHQAHQCAFWDQSGVY